jgi:hypothetical protein
MREDYISNKEKQSLLNLMMLIVTTYKKDITLNQAVKLMHFGRYKLKSESGAKLLNASKTIRDLLLKEK